MRNPIRFKNLSLRFAPFYLLGVALVISSDVSWPALIVGSLPVIAGLGLRSWGAGHLVKNARFTVTGPYAHLRHPLYLGTILVGVGFSLSLGGWVGLAALAIVVPWFFLSYFPRKERVESNRLEELYGDEYTLYRSQVPPLLPRLQAWRPAGVLGAGVDGRWHAEYWDENNELGTLMAALVGLALVALRAGFG